MFEWFNEESAARNLAALEQAGVHVMGRRSYEIMGPYWVASEGPIARAMNEKPKAVFSSTLLGYAAHKWRRARGEAAQTRPSERRSLRPA